MDILSTLLRRAGKPTLAGSLLLAAIGLPFGASAQRVLWADAQVSAAARPATQPLSQYRAVSFQLPAVREVLATAPTEKIMAARASATVVSLPLPDGTSQRFRVVQVPVLAPALAARYTTIRTYMAQGVDDPTATARLDVSPAGFHAMILASDKTVYIDPTGLGQDTHLVFERRAMNRGAFPFVCATPSAKEMGVVAAPSANQTTLANGATLRTYRLALACTGEYAAFHGGTKAGALAAMVASMNRVNGIYEKELAVRMVLVAQTEDIIFLDPATDPYTNNDGEAMLNQNQATLDARIGNTNYDIGHVFSTGGGGIAQRPAVCISGKARGVTGLSAPVNDAFDIDYVAHEMGHQFGADHTFNSVSGSCGGGTRAPSSAYEPGSGNTIMAYAGICGSDNIQPVSDPYFHSRSIDQILAHITGAGNCSVNTSTGNTPPAVDAGRNYAIPISTPFVLTGSATDANGDALTYAWEQFNLGPGGAVNAPSGNAPIFREFLPSLVPSRTFPRLSDLVNNTRTVGELLPTYGRRLVFRLVARDNRAGGGGVDYDSMNVVVVPTAGPFVVTLPNTPTTWLATAPHQVSWEVANTTAAPINAAAVDILLSTDGGLTYPTTLLANTPNDGAETVTIPASVGNSSSARIRVQASGGIFFDISDQNFTIQVPAGPAFFLNPGAITTIPSLCPGTSSGSQALTVGALQGFNGTATLGATNLPAGVTISFGSSTVAVGSATTYTINTSSATPAGTYTSTLTGTSGGITQSQQIRFTVLPAATQTALITAPGAGTRTTLRPLFSWTTVANAASYDVQVATDAGFTNLVINLTGVTGSSVTAGSELLPNTTYYVRVRGVSICGPAPYSVTTMFQTGTQVCQTFVASQVPVALSATSTASVTSAINVISSERVSAIRIRNVTIAHPNVGELEISLTNPAGTRVVLFSGLCAGTANLNLSFDEAAATALTCPLVSGGTVRPANSLGPLLNGPANGNWILTISDNVTGNDGTLTGWALELCTLAEPPVAPTSLTTLAPVLFNNAANIDLIWLDGSTTETGFEVERSANGGTFDRIATVGPNISFYTDRVSANSQYCYRVRAINSSGNSDYSNVSCQTVSTITAVRNAGLLQGTEVFPNPSSGVFEVKIDNAQQGSITLRVTDALGRTVSSQTLNKGAAAIQQKVDLSGLSTGLYTLHLDMPKGSTVVRLLKQ
ncbi:Por secretion system C-terminal sorting domain-containing protein [Hymenobacter gelipurpurascens]|uniref:Por secretion system C-terminal sorting domain-containing protein n=1 Tax=Hymenobacter gelipurpurascens TaxID=89968 RepID=A0A212TPF8_9BACT|nr:zinc-dependent metalloprotease family protein [Hymenobacter gelipurpurascens]SNC67909.1 Por secretion system C-terminal sorting domain-containing protein [Hymenobacter gelipurpurascens]